MLDVTELKVAMLRKGYTQKDLANKLGISEKTFCQRIKSRQFGTDEIEKLIALLEIQNPMAIFFAGSVTCGDT